MPQISVPEGKIANKSEKKKKMKEKEKVLLSKNGMGWGAVFERKDENVEIIP